MRFTSFVALTLSSLSYVSCAPAASSAEDVQIPLAVPYLTEPRTITFTVPESLTSFFDWANKKGDEGDVCPRMKVSCSKDGKTVGNIGKKPFCRSGVTCGQCHQTENTAECNAKFLTECKAQCEAQGPLGGTLKMIEWFA